MKDREKSAPAPIVTESHRRISNLLQCPVMSIQMPTINPLSSKHKNALIIGLLASMSSFAVARKRSSKLSSSGTLSLFAGVFASYLSHKYSNQTTISEAKELCETGHFDPEGEVYRTGTDPSLLIAGIAAAKLQMLHPDVVRIINESGGFYNNPELRTDRTGAHHRSTIYGNKIIADAASLYLIILHETRTAKDPLTNKEYTVNRPDLLLWVHNSLVWMMVQTFRVYGPKINEDKFVKEFNIFGRLVGLNIPLPSSMKELDDYMDEMVAKEKLAFTPQTARFQDFFDNRSSPHVLHNVFQKLFLSAGMRLMSPMHQKLFGFKSSKLSDFLVQKLTSATISVLRYGIFPAEKMIKKARTELLVESFGDHLLKGENLKTARLKVAEILAAHRTDDQPLPVSSMKM